MPLTLAEHRFSAHVPELGNAANILEVPVLVRVDPLTGHTSRVVHGEKLAPATRPDLTELTAPPRFCPFCADTIERATGLLDPRVTEEGRIRRGVSAIVPNVVAYSRFCSVGLYDVTRHFVDLDQLTPAIVGDLLTGLAAYTRGVASVRPTASEERASAQVGPWNTSAPGWHSISANYLPPSGSSMIHPHAQSSHDPIGTTVQRQLVAASRAWPGERSFWDELVEAEAGGPRWLGARGRVVALTPWSPMGFHEVWALVPGVADVTALTDEDCRDLGAVLSGTFAAYHALNLASFNWALYGGGPEPGGRYSLLLRVVSRSNPEPMYRSDVTYFERLHGEAVLDLTPEQVADLVRPHVAAALSA